VAQDREKSDSVFDFLFVDNRRIGLYLSQFSEFGNLTNLVESVGTTDATQVRGSVGASSTHIGGQADSTLHSGVQRHYDTQWVAPLSFLEEIQDRKMLKRSLGDAHTGDLVILSGSLTLANLRVFERTLQMGEGLLPLSTPTGNRAERRRQTTQPANNAASMAAATGIRFLATLEQPIFMLFVAGTDGLWATIDPTCVVGSASDLHLKHGTTIEGKWHLVGILDCLPSVGPIAPISRRVVGDKDNTFGEALIGMLQEHRLLMGRPSDCYGITPLIIMREIG
jgi:hypothetical protein